MRRLLILFVLLPLLAGCGYLHDARLTEEYWENVVLETSPQLNLVVWPIHGIALTFCAVVDQTIRTFEIFFPASRDAYQFLILRGNGNNIMFEHTILLPKTIATPLVFVGSYIVRWFIPISDEEQPFKMRESGLIDF